MKIFKRISIIVLIVLCIASISFAAYLLNATQVSYDKNGTSVPVQDTLDDLYTKVPKKVFSQGQLVTYKGEEFYSLYDVSSTATTMEIFATRNLIDEATDQADDNNGETQCIFSGANYWRNEWMYEPKLNLNNVTGYTSTDALGKVNTYARTKGAIRGRLLTLEEVCEIGAYDEDRGSFDYTNSTIIDMIAGAKNTSHGGYENYWLASSNEVDDASVYCLNGLMLGMGHGSVLDVEVNNIQDSEYGVRPVLTVYKSDVTPVS